MVRNTQVEIQSHPWYHRHHHRAGGFRNLYGQPSQEPFLKAAGWLIQHGLARKENVPAPVTTLNAMDLQTPPARLRITWLGHSATLIQTPSHTLLTDPMLGRRASPLSFAGPKRLAPVPLRIEDLPPIDGVLLSHDHYDHLDKGSVLELHKRFDPQFVAPLGVDAILNNWDIHNVWTLDWWQYVDWNGLRLHMTPAEHFSGRGATHRNGTLWAGYYLEWSDLRVYYAGDSAYARLFGEIQGRLGTPEVALLPIGAYQPRWLMKPVHINPHEAVQAFVDLQAEHFIPIHWGTFDLADEPLQEPLELVQAEMEQRKMLGRLHPLPIGGYFEL